MSEKEEFIRRRNAGEGNQTAAREYNGSQQRSVPTGKVEQKAYEAEQDLRNQAIRRELEHAETVGKRHIAEEDAQIKRR